MNVIEINHLKKYYGTSRGVERATFNVKKGEIHGFIGPNGAGKSTVIRVIMGLLHKTSGSIKILGNCPSSEMNQKIGYLPSEVYMFSELNVLEQLKYFARVRGVSEERIYELAETLDLDLKRKIKDLSFGNKKKVGIVASLLHSPEILILDEPTSGLDPLIQQKFFSLLLQEKQKGCSILLSSHVLNEVEKICDVVSLIKEGEVLFTDSISNLKKSTFKKVIISPVINLTMNDLNVISSVNQEITYSYNGNINDLVKELSKFNIDKLNIVDLDLEEIFMHYYQKENTK